MPSDPTSQIPAVTCLPPPLGGPTARSLKPPATTEIVKSANSKRRKSGYRDAATIQALLGAAALGETDAETETVVRVDVARFGARSSRSKGRSKAFSPKPNANSSLAGLHQRLDPVGPTTRKHHVAAEWRDTTDRLKAKLAHYVLALDGEFCSFTLNLGRDVESQALSMGQEAKRWLANRVRHHLVQALGRPVRFWFRLEKGKGLDPYLHLHGEIGCAYAERAAICVALRKVGGGWLGTKQTQADTGKGRTPDIGWALYAMKLDWLVVIPIVTGRPSSELWRNDDFMISQELSRASKIFYDGLRKKLRIEMTPLRDCI